MNDLDKSSQTDHQQAVKDWWNSLQTKEKWTGATYQDNWETHLHYWIRQKKTLEFIDNCNPPKDAKIFVSSSSVTEIIASAPDTPASFSIAVSNASPYRIL